MDVVFVVALGNDEEVAVVGGNGGVGFVFFGVDGFAQVFGFGPGVSPAAGDIEVGVAVTAGTVGRE